MALLFEIVIEHGIHKGHAETAVQHFQGRQYTLSDGLLTTISALVYQDLELNWWCFAWPSGLSTSGVCNDKDTRQMNEMANHLYSLLRTAPDFRYALVGIEVEEFRNYSEIKGLDDLDLDGVVISEAIWKQIGKPSHFIPFRPGYFWIPFITISLED